MPCNEINGLSRTSATACEGSIQGRVILVGMPTNWSGERPTARRLSVNNSSLGNKIAPEIVQVTLLLTI